MYRLNAPYRKPDRFTQCLGGQCLKRLTVKLAVTRRRRRRLQIMIGLWWYDPSRPTALWEAGRRRVWAPLTSRPVSPSGSVFMLLLFSRFSWSGHEVFLTE